MKLNRDSLLFFILPILFLAFCHGCAVKRPPPETVVPLPPVSDPAGVIKKVSGYDDHSAVSGIIRLRIHSPDRRISTRAAVSAKKPFFLRFEALTLFSNPAMLYLSDGKRIHLFFHEENELFQGVFSDDAPYLLFGIPLSLSDFLNILLGHTPVYPTQDTDITVSQDGMQYLFSLNHTPHMTCRIWIDPETMLPAKYTRYISGNRILEVSFSNHQKKNAGLFPRNINLILAMYDITLSVTYLSSTHEDIPDTYFSFSPPTGARVFPLEELLYQNQDE